VKCLGVTRNATTTHTITRLARTLPISYDTRHAKLLAVMNCLGSSLIENLRLPAGTRQDAEDRLPSH
jgi:hypothetical protein